MNALQIVDQVRNRYCMCSSYMDEGFVEMRRSDRLEGLVEVKTYYRQPNQFRFEFKKNAPIGKLMNFYVCKNRQECFSHSPQMGSDIDRSDLNTAIAGVTGVSFGAAVHIPALLMPAIKCHRLIDYENYELMEDNSPQARDECYILVVDDEGTKITLYVRKEDFSIAEIWKESTPTGDDQVAEILERIPEELRSQYVDILSSGDFTKKLLEPIKIRHEYRRTRFNEVIREDLFQPRHVPVRYG